MAAFSSSIFSLKPSSVSNAVLNLLIYSVVGNLRHDHSHDHQGQNTQNAG